MIKEVAKSRTRAIRVIVLIAMLIISFFVFSNVALADELEDATTQNVNSEDVNETLADESVQEILTETLEEKTLPAMLGQEPLENSETPDETLSTAVLGDNAEEKSLDTITEVQVVAEEEHIIAATSEDIVYHYIFDEDIDNPLQDAIDKAVENAKDGVAHVILNNDTVYEGNGVWLSNDEVDTYIFESAEGGIATINSDIEVGGDLILLILNILFGNDSTLLVDNDASLTIGSEDKRFTGTINLMAGDPDIEDPDIEDRKGYITVNAGNGAAIYSNIICGTVEVKNSAGDSVVFSGNNNVAVSSKKSQETTEECTIAISAKNELNIQSINAWDANIVVYAPVITVEKASGKDRNELRSLKIYASSENGELTEVDQTEFVEKTELNEFLPQVGVDSSLIKVSAPAVNAQVNINASITSLKDIIVYSYVTQTGYLLSVPGVKLAMNVKIGNATIELKDGITLEALGDITLKATARAEAGFGDNGKPENCTLPVAFNVFIENASVNLGTGTTLKASGDITADALSSVKANASCSFGSLFVGIAFNVIINDASVEATGTHLYSGGDVNLISKAETIAIASATRGQSNKSNDGMYFATNVVIQSSETHVGAETEIVALKDVNIYSTSDVDATDDAIASVGTKTSDVSATTVNDVFKIIKNKVLKKVKDAVLETKFVKSTFKSIKNFFTTTGSKIGKAINLFETEGYVVEVDSESQEKGTIKVSTVSEEKGTLTISIDSKYNVEQVLVRYLPTGKADYYAFVKAIKNDTTGKYEVDINKAIKDAGDIVTLRQFRVYVIYGEMKSEVELDDMPPAAPADDDDDDIINLSDLFDNAVEAAADDSDADSDCGGNIELEFEYKYDGKVDNNKGRVVTDAMRDVVKKDTTTIQTLVGVAAGKNVRLNPNPNLTYQIKSIIALYTNNNDEEKTITIEKNNAGHYVFEVPSDIKDKKLKIVAEFEDAKEGKSQKETPSSTQVTGSLAVGVVINSNNVIVDLDSNSITSFGSGSIEASGQVNIIAEATTNITGKADGTAVTKADIEKGNNVTQAASGDALGVKTYDVTKDGENTGEKLYVYGQSNEGTTAVVNGTEYTVTLNPQAEFGYTLPETIAMILLCDDNREYVINFSGVDGIYTIDISKIDFKNKVLAEEIQQSKLNILSKKIIAKYSIATYKVSTDKVENGKVTVDKSSVTAKDTITIKNITPNNGYEFKEALLKYKITKSDGTEVEQTLTFVPGLEGTYKCQLPGAEEISTWVAGSIKVSVTFKKIEESKLHTIEVDGSISANITVDKTKATNGEKVTIKLKEGMNYIMNAAKFKVTYKDKDGKDITVNIDKTDLSFTIPAKDALSNATKFTVNAENGYVTEAKVEIEVDSSISNGKVTIDNKRTKTCGGDAFTVTVKGNDGYILKSGTLTAEWVNGSTTIKLGTPVKVSDGVYKFSVNQDIGNDSGKITIKAEFKKNDSVSDSIGIAVAVGVGIHKNNAVISSGAITAGKGITVSTITNGKGIREALAGYSEGRAGVAGAIAVEVISYKTNAIIEKDAYIGAGDSAEHELKVNATSNISAFKTSADSSNIKSTSGETGVGTGIAVGVNGIDTTASINDGVIYGYTRALNKTSVTAKNTLTSDEVSAKAGSKSKKLAVTPVVALNIIGSNVKAYLGKFAEDKFLNSKIIEVISSNSAAHTMNVDTSATGSTSVMAGSFGINIIDDTSKAIINSNIGGSESVISVDSQSVSTLTANTKASAAGAKEGKKAADDSKGSADKKADNIINSGEKIAAKTGMDSAAPTADKTKNRQQAQTAEGTIAGAAAFILNIQNNKSEARIEDGVILGGETASLALGDINVDSRAMTSADITADGSATSKNKAGGSEYGIGVAVAINIVSTENKAYIGTGLLNAGNVSVTAQMTNDDDGNEQMSAFKTTSISGASAGGVGVAGSVALAVLNNITYAKIIKEQNDIYKATGTKLVAKDRRSAETTATASKAQDGKADKNTSKTDKEKAADADKNKSVGVGASFAMVYGDNIVTAEFIPPASADAGEIICEAEAEHYEESTAVAGTDPYAALFDPASFKYTGKSTNIAVDASVAVNAIYTEIAALIGGATYTPTVNAKSTKIRAKEKGHSKTDASGFAMGTETAVGGAVAVNLNRSNVRSSNNSFLKVSGDDYSDDEEGHSRSVEISASSEVTEENFAFATASGSDILRYIEKYKSLLTADGKYAQELIKIEKEAEKIAKIIQGFLDGSLFEDLKIQFESAISSYKEVVEGIKKEIASTGKTDKSTEETEAAVANSGNSLADKLQTFIKLAKDVQAAGSKTLSLGSNLLKMLGIGTKDTKKMDATTNKATSEAKKEINGTDTSSQTGKQQKETKVDNNGEVGKKEESTQIAAAVSVSISNHKVIAENKGEIVTVGGAKISADNSIDAVAHALGSAFSTHGGTGSIALAIAVKVDNNYAKATSQKSITTGEGKDVDIIANFIENTHDYSDNTSGIGATTDFTSEIGTQAVAGAVSGNAKVAISGAIVVFISSSKTLAELTDNAKIQALDEGRSGNVSVVAYEKVRQTLRTVAISGSSANLTLGISSGVIVTSNETQARVGKDTLIRANNINVKAVRESVSLENDKGISVETTEDVPDFGSEDTTDDGQDDTTATTGVDIKGLFNNDDSIIKIDTKKATIDGKEKQTIAVSIDRDKTTDLLEDALNTFSHVDYYVAIDSGSVAAGSVKSSSQLGSIAGSVAVVIINNTVSAIVDEGAVLDSLNDIIVVAESSEQTRIISGAISLSLSSQGKVSIGSVIAFLDEDNSIEACVNDGAVLSAGRDINIIGKNTGKSEVYTVTASGAAGSTATVAATIDVILSESTVDVKLGNPGSEKSHTAQGATIIAENSKNLRNITVSLAGGKASVQVGGAVAVILEESSAIVIADRTKLNVTGKDVQYNTDQDGKLIPYALDSIVIKADNTHDMFIIVCSASVAGGAKENIAGVVSVILDTSIAKISTLGSEITSNVKNPKIDKAGNIIISAINESDLLNINLEATLSFGQSTAAVGASVTVNILRREVINNISTENQVTSILLHNGDVCLSSDAKDHVVIVAAGANGSSSTVSVQGCIVVLVENNKVEVIAQKLTLDASNLGTIISCGDVTIRAKFTGGLYGVAGGINFTMGSVAAGATTVVSVTNNATLVDIIDSNISSSHSIDIISASDLNTLFISIGTAVSGSVSAEGSIVTVVATDDIYIHLGSTSITSGEVNILALGKSSETLISGAVAASLEVSVGPSVIVFVKERQVVIDSTAGGMIGGENGCIVNALAQADDNIFTLVLAMAASGTVSVSAGMGVEVINNVVKCDIDADINAGDYEITIGALSDRTIANYIFGGGFSGAVSVVPVISVVYLTDKTTADISGNLKGHIVSITADNIFNLKEIAAGAAISGTAGIDGTFAIVVNESETKAMFTGTHSGEGNAPELNVLANDVYKFKSIMANLAAAGVAGVGVNAAVTVVKNTVSATIGDALVKKNIKADKINVNAQSIREIKNIVGVLSFGGTAGASVNVCVVVAGSELPQDAYDMLTSPDEGSNTFNSEKILSSISNGNAYVYNMDYLATVTLTDDIKGNGQKDSDIKGSEVDGSKFVKDLAEDYEDYTSTSDSATEAETLRGEDSNIDPSQDASVIANAEAGRNAAYTYTDNISAIVQARVYNVSIDTKEISVSASDIQKASIDSITGAGGFVGASVGVSVIVLHSNVIAEIEDTADITCRQLDINAYSGTGEDGEIKVIGGVAGAGSVGVAVAVSVVHLDNFVKASLAGNVTAALRDNSGINNAINIIANSDYKNVLAETIAIGAGAVGVSASTAVISLNGTVLSTLGGHVIGLVDASGNIISGFQTINVLVFFNNSIIARAASFGGGAVSVTMGVAVASETLNVKAGIESGATVTLDSIVKGLVPVLRVMIAGAYDKNANTISQGLAQGTAQVLGGSGGAVAVGVAVAVAYIEPNIESYINGTVNNTLGGLEITVGNNIYTKSETGLAAVVAGAGSFGANVLVSYNTTQAKSSVTGNVTAEILNVVSLVSANAVSSMINIQAANTAIGVSTAIAILNAVNEAIVGTGANINVNTLNILAGAAATGEYQDGANFFSQAQVFAGTVSPGIAVSLNVAVAFNDAQNKATLKTNGNVIANTVNVFAYGNPTASSAANELSGSLFGAGGSAAASTLNFKQIVTIECDSIKGRNNTLTSVNAGSYMYPGNAKDIDGEKFEKDYNQANSSVDSFAITGISIGANVSYSKNTTISKVSAKFKSKVGPVIIINDGSANSLARIAQTGASGLGVGANVILSYVQAQFIIDLNTVDVEGNVNLTNDFVSNATSTVKAASGSLASLKVNAVIAKSTTKGSTVFDGNNGNVKSNSIYVNTTGESTTKAEVLKPHGSFSAITIATNVIESILKTTQEAILKNMNILGSPDITVTSILNAGASSNKNSALAKYEGAPNAVDITGVGVNVNVVLAKNYATNLARISGISSSDKINNITVTARNKSNACADAGTSKDGNGFDVTLVGIGVVVTNAYNNGKNFAEFINSFVNAASLEVIATQTDASANSYGGTSSGGVASLANIAVNVSDAKNNAENKALISGCGSTGKQCIIDKILLQATAENVYASSYIGSADLAVALVSVAANIVSATNNYNGTAIIENSNLKGNYLDVQSLENQHYYEEGKYNSITTAEVGSAGGKNISFVNGSGNTATAENISNVKASITGSVLTDFVVGIFADGRSDVKTNIASPANIGLLNVAIIRTYSNANGTVLAQFNPTEELSNISALNVKALGSATSNAITGVAGSISANLVSMGANIAEANAQMIVKAIVSGGKLNVRNNAVIEGIGSAVVTSEAQAPGFSVNLISVGINKAIATSEIKVEADVEPGEYSFMKQLTVNARIPAKDEIKYVIDNTTVYFEKSTTTSIVRPSVCSDGSKDVSFNLIGGNNHTSDATSSHSVVVNIGKDGKGTISAGTIIANAIGNAETLAKALDVDVSYGLVSAGGSISTAYENDSAIVNLNADIINAIGSIEINARNDSADVNSEGTTPGGITLVGIVETTISSTINNIATINVNGIILSATDSINFNAENKGSATSGFGAYSKVSGLLEIQNASVPVKEEFNTNIVFVKDSIVQAAKNIIIKTNTYSKGDSHVYQRVGGAVFDATTLYGTVTVNSINNITVGENAQIKAQNGQVKIDMINSGNHRAESDYNSSFELIGVNHITAEARYNADNILQMEKGAVIAAENNSVYINQNSSDLIMDCSTDTTTNKGFGGAYSCGNNIVKSNNKIIFTLIKAGNNIFITQYGGASDAQAYGKVNVTAAISDCEGAGTNNFTINNYITALSGSDMNAKDIMLFQGTDRLNMNAGARPMGGGLFISIKGSARNDIVINNKLEGITDEIGIGAKRIYISYINAKGDLVCEMRKSSSGIDFGKVDAENNLTVYFTKADADTYKGFFLYQDAFTGKTPGGATTILYKPQLEQFVIDEPVKPVNPDEPEYPEYPDYPSYDSNQDLNENSITELFIRMLEYSKNISKKTGRRIALSIDEEGYLVVKNSAFVAVSVENIDIDWLYDLFTSKDLKFMGNNQSFKKIRLNTKLSTLVNNSSDATDVEIKDDIITFCITNDNVKLKYEIRFDKESKKASIYYIDGEGNKVPVTVLMIQQKGKWNAVVCSENVKTKSSIIMIPELEKGKLQEIKVKLSEEALEKIYKKYIGE